VWCLHAACTLLLVYLYGVAAAAQTQPWWQTSAASQGLVVWAAGGAPWRPSAALLWCPCCDPVSLFLASSGCKGMGGQL
jgi:hypothetical protein